MKKGDLVKFIDAADRNTSGWRESRKLGMVLSFVDIAGKPWAWVKFHDGDAKVFSKDLEVISAGR
tara:strand:+ start:10034 stop:10228 length:195 start_codon:yes stop_codon:yes gene_type:complete